MSDPIEDFEKNLERMSLNELQSYKRVLDERIKEEISKDTPNEKIAPLILYRGVIEHQIKLRAVQKG